jgi:hypothetical protein
MERSRLRTAAITYGNGELKACEQDEVWTVRLANLEVRASYLDLALAELLGNAPEAHRAAARLLSELSEVMERQEAYQPVAAPGPQPERLRRARPEVWPTAAVLGLRALVIAVVASTAFMLTTWFSTLR